MSGGDTLPGLLFRNATRWPNRPAWRHKRLGIWQTVTWSAFAARTRAIGHGLAALGFHAGDRLAVLGDNRPDLYAALLAAQAQGGVGVPLDPDMDPARLAAILEETQAGIAVADTVEQAERLHAAAEALSRPVRVFCADGGGPQGAELWQRQSLDALADPESYRGLSEVTAMLATGAPEDIALLLYPVAAAQRPLALSHPRLLAAAEAITAADPVQPNDQTLSYLPMASYDDALYSLTLGLLGGFTCNCPEAPDSALRDLREIGPTVLFAPPEVCVALAQAVTGKAASATGLKRRVLQYFQDAALRGEARQREGAMPPTPSASRLLGELLVYAPVRDQLGLSRTRWIHTGAPVPYDTARVLRAFGVALRPGADRAIETSAAGEPRETLHV